MPNSVAICDDGHLQLVWLYGRRGRPLVPGSIREPVAVRGRKVVKDGRTSRPCMIRSATRRLPLEPRAPSLTIWILHGNDLLVVVEVVQQGGKYAPARVELVISHKVGVVPLQTV